MSALTLICCFVLMLASLNGEFSVEIPAYTGQNVKLPIIGNDCEEPSLYTENGTAIALLDYAIDIQVNTNYKGRIHIDTIIWFKGVEKKDAGRYYIKCGMDKKNFFNLVVMEPTQEQLQECPNNRPDFPKEGSDSFNSGMLSAIFIILILNIILTNKTYIRKGWITAKNWIQKTFCSLDRNTEQLHYPSKSTRVTIDKLELTEDQVHCWLDDHPDFVEKYHGNLDDRIQKLLSILLASPHVKKSLEKMVEDQIQKWLTFYPGPLLVKKYFEPHDIVEGHDTVSSQETPVICPDEFGVSDRFPEVVSGEEENQTIVSVNMFERNNSPRMQPERNVRSDRGFTSEDPDVDSALLGEEYLRHN